MKYPKINTIWNRDDTAKGHRKGKIIEGEFSRQEFASINRWHITEKIDGTNVRINYHNKVENPTITFGGRTDDAQLPTHLVNYLNNTFTIEKFKSIVNSPNMQFMRLFGEGYGAKIQKGGGLYRKDAGFILFDVWIDGWWLEREAVKDIADKLGIGSVPEFGIMNTVEAIDIVRAMPNSAVAEEPKVIEGVVARSYPLMLFRDGTPIIWKLKCKDYKV